MAMGDACEMIAELRAAVPLPRAKNLLMGATGLCVALAMSLTLTCVCEPSADLTFTVDGPESDRLSADAAEAADAVLDLIV